MRQTALDAYANQDVPFEKLLSELKPERDLSRTSIFQVYFNLFSFWRPNRFARRRFDELRRRLAGSRKRALSKFDLTLYAGVAEREIKLALVYNTDLFSPARMEEMLAQLEHLLAQAVRNPDQNISAFSLVTPNVKHVLPDSKREFARREFKSITRHFSDQAERHPQAIAVSDSRTKVTYADLDAHTNQLANYLLASGIEKGDIVAIYAHRNASLLVAILGVLKAGAAFTILDPAYPSARLVECLRIAQPRAWIQIEAAGEPPVELREFVDELRCCCALTLTAPNSVGAGLVPARTAGAALWLPVVGQGQALPLQRTLASKSTKTISLTSPSPRVRPGSLKESWAATLR